MKKGDKTNKSYNYIFLALRYLFILIIGLFSLQLIYLIFTPLTIYPVDYILNLFYNSTIYNSSIIIGNYQINIVEACIAGSAYYLLLILNLSVSMKLKQRFYSLFYSLFIFLILNISRIVILSVLFINNSLFFDFTHKLFWYALSTLFVVLIWFSEVKIFKIKEIPFYSDTEKIVLRKLLT